MSARRIWAMVLRYWFLLRRSVPRMIDMVCWPLVDVVMWGFLSQFLAGNSSFVAKAAGVLLAGMFLWDVLSRSQLGVSVGFLEEIWARHLGHMFVSPLRSYEWLTSLMVISIFRTVVGLAPAVVVAMVIYHFSLFDLGLPLAGFIANLMMMGWWLGLLVVAAIMRYGQGAENLAWAAPFVLSPLGAVYYPVSTLPLWLQHVALALPAAHIFEGMRGVMVDHVFHPSLLVDAALLNLVYLALSSVVFLWSFHGARKRGKILQMGE
jgi:ABC-2 type transport system permease protein